MDQHAWKCKVRSPRSWRVKWPEHAGSQQEGSLGQGLEPGLEGEGTERTEPTGHRRSQEERRVETGSQEASQTSA